MQNTALINRTLQYAVSTDFKSFITSFEPVDLIRKTGNCFTIIKGLEKVFEQRKNIFLDNLRKISEIRKNPGIGNTLPDYIRIYEKNSILYAESQYYNSDRLECTDTDGLFFYKVSEICRIMNIITAITGKEPVLDLNNIFFEKNIPYPIHVLHIDLNSAEKSPLCNQLSNIIIYKFYGRKQRYSDYIRKADVIKQCHPKLKKLVQNLIISLSPVSHKASNWNYIYDTSEKICRLIDEDPDYLLNPYTPVKKNVLSVKKKIQNALNTFGHVIFLQSDDKDLLYRISDSFVLESCEEYGYTARGCAANGLLEMLEGNSFALHSGLYSAMERISAIRSMCSDRVLLIIDECDIENDIFFRKVLQLPADILILTEQDYSEYGFHTINFKKTGNNKYE